VPAPLRKDLNPVQSSTRKGYTKTMAKRWYVLVDSGECVCVSSRKVAIRRLSASNPSLTVDETNVMTERQANERLLTASVQSH